MWGTVSLILLEKFRAYPFGYGKSYTTFWVETKDILLKNSEIVLNVQVTNAGKNILEGK